MENNMLNKVKKIIILLLIIIFIIIIFLFIQNKIKKENNTYDPNYSVEVEKRDAKLVDVAEEYYAIKTCVDIYYTKISSFKDISTNEYIEDAERARSKEVIANSLLNIFDQEYIDDFNVTKDSIVKMLDKQRNFNFIIDNMYVFDLNDNVAMYIVYGKEVGDNGNNESGMIVKVDRENQAFSIMPYEYIVKNDYQEVSNVDTNKFRLEELEKNDNNTFEQQPLDNESVAINMFQNYKIKVQYEVEDAYELIEQNYRDKRFSTLKKYKEYAKEIKTIFDDDRLSKIKTNELDNGDIEYICIDTYGNYFIFTTSDGLNYNVVLDIYTIERKEFKEQYKKANEEKKVALNIEKFKQMINGKDYMAAYNVLDKTFRDTNFGSVEKFEEYIKNNWFECNKFTYIQSDSEGEIYTLETNIYNALDNESEANVFQKTFIMKLEEGTDFVMSFNV